MKGEISGADLNLTIREYRSDDYSMCRQLWVELTEHHRRIYQDPFIGGEDPGEGFDDYLSSSAWTQSWVAEIAGEVVGLTGLFEHGTSAEVEPIVGEDGRRRARH
jgi:hypothetical protein